MLTSILINYTALLWQTFLVVKIFRYVFSQYKFAKPVLSNVYTLYARKTGANRHTVPRTLIKQRWFLPSIELD